MSVADPMKRQSKEAARVTKLIARLNKAHPDARLALNFSSPFELLAALILAAQCTDEKVNEVTASLFKKYHTPEDYVRVSAAELEADIRPTGFYRNKTKALQRCCQQLIDSFGGQVPDTLEALTTLHGVGRKTANILLGNAFGRQAIGVDTHVARLSQRLGLTRHTDPDKIEADLLRIVPQRWWTRWCHLLQFHGRQVCVARAPKCPQCVVIDLCPYPEKTVAPPKRAPRPAFGRRP